MSTSCPTWRRVISGDAHGPGPSLARGALRVLSVPYGWATSLRDAAVAGDAVKVGLPTISIGNLTAGGTGKTPVVSMLVTELKKRGRRPVILSRGYCGEPGKPNDEAQVLARQHPDVIHLQGKDRLALARHAADAKLGDTLVLDDGFQYLALHRDMNVCCIDATNPFGYGAVLPRGLLRERMSALYRARPVLITRAELAPPGRVAEIQAEVRRWNEFAKFVVSEMKVTGTTDCRGTDRAKASDLAGKRVLCVSGIGNAAAFAANVRMQDARVAAQVDFDDHHDWTVEDLKAVMKQAAEVAAELVVTTAKDAVKIAALDCPPPSLPIRVLDVEVSIRDGAETWSKMIDEALASA